MYKSTHLLLKNLGLNVRKAPSLEGIMQLKRVLEKDFFAEVSITSCDSDSEDEDLVIDLQCPFTLVELLYHMQQKNWDEVVWSPEAGKYISRFSQLFDNFRVLSDQRVDIEEFNLLLNDCSITIKRIYPYSIEKEIGNLLNAIAAHYVYLTKNLTETPNEIYIPVFEAMDSEEMTANPSQAVSNDYFKYWALYFDSQEDAAIYEIHKNSIVPGSLFYNNQ